MHTFANRFSPGSRYSHARHQLHMHNITVIITHLISHIGGHITIQDTKQPFQPRHIIIRGMGTSITTRLIITTQGHPIQRQRPIGTHMSQRAPIRITPVPSRAAMGVREPRPD
jgi:hypothetical protein